MEVILKEDVAKLGSRGDVVKVAEGYGRNYLLPRKLAIEATLANKAVIEQMKAAAVRRTAKEKTEAEALAKQFEGLSVSFQRKSGENDQLFGSVTSSDIAEALEKKSFHIDRRKLQLHEPLKSVGEGCDRERSRRRVIPGSAGCSARARILAILPNCFVQILLKPALPIDSA
jgi:large subunit ribosomal protein L9